MAKGEGKGKGKGKGQPKGRTGGSGVRKAVKKAGPTIERREMKKITRAAGGDAQKALKQITKARASLSSGAANTLIKKPPASGYGSTRIGKTLQQMAGTPGRRGVMRQGQLAGGTPGIPGTGLMPGGMMIRPGGRTAVKPQIATQPFDTSAYDQTISDLTTRINELETADNAGSEFDYDSLSRMISEMMPAAPVFPDYTDMFADLQAQMAAMQQPTAEFATPDPIQLAPLGQSYTSDMIRARAPQVKRRSDYLRTGMPFNTTQAITPLLIGGGLTL